jgi:dihydrofolate reductase
MGKVTVDMSMSLDGFSAGPGDGFGCGLGIGGERLHSWVFGGEWSYGDEAGRATGVDREVLDEIFACGAHIVGRRMFDVVEGWGYQNPFDAPCFVLTHRVDEGLLAKAPSFTFVTDGIDSALEQARAVAGGKDVSIAGGVNVAQQYLRAGLVDEMQIHLAPVFLGTGKRLFENLQSEQFTLKQDRVIVSPLATHLRYVVGRS